MLIREEQKNLFSKEVNHLSRGDYIENYSCLKSDSSQLDDIVVMFAKTHLDNLDLDNPSRIGHCRSNNSAR